MGILSPLCHLPLPHRWLASMNLPMPASSCLLFSCSVLINIVDFRFDRGFFLPRLGVFLGLILVSTLSSWLAWIIGIRAWIYWEPGSKKLISKRLFFALDEVVNL
ncbi:hypothetical protein BDZ91DRAFT_543837 [Kalaharituber pfeilii]|nr:hypothetical protein BDZ91DRAFT_543837 [Kalaharituber pfeilii]